MKQKEYHAVVVGKIPESGKINTPVNKQEALTVYNTAQQVTALQNEFLSLIKLEPKTGRTHQLRIHLSELSFPIVGDKLYAPKNIMMHKGLFLAATNIELLHPSTQEPIIISTAIPNKINSYLAREHKRFEKYKA